MKIVSALSALTHILSRPALVFWTLPWLMILLVAGTVAQKYVGLYIAQKTFFSSFILWLGPLPLPGGYTVISIIFAGLLCKFIAESRWSWQRAGIILTHFGVLVLLAGGILTALTSKEGFMVIDEGEQSQTIEDYHDRHLSILKDGEVIHVIPQNRLSEDLLLGLEEGLPFNVKIISTFTNADPQQRENEELQENGLKLHGPAQKIKMIPIKPDKQNENNHGGLTVAVRGTGADTDGLYLMTEIMPLYPQIEIKDHVYELRYTKVRSLLPFTLSLDDVEKESHPGMDMAKAYRSVITINDQDATWPAEISMNNPLRYRGYTFYQSSYIQRPDGETTVLSVVWNKGRLFPYIASFLISLGLILHLVIQIKPRKIIPILLSIFVLQTAPAWASGPEKVPAFDMQEFSMIPILHEGRLKPMGTFAATMLQKFSSQTKIDNMDSLHWLAELLFDPTTAAQRPVFSIRDRNLRHVLGLTDSRHHLYSFTTVITALEPHQERLEKLSRIPTDKLEAQQKDLVLLQTQLADYMQIMRSFSLILPLAIAPPSALLKAEEKEEYSEHYLDYLKLQKLESRAQEKLKNIIKRKGEDPSRYTEDEKEVALFSWQMATFSGSSQGNQIFRVMIAGPAQDRFSPWAVLQEGRGSPATAALLEEWKILGLAWLERDTKTWQQQSKILRQKLTPSAAAFLSIERLYNLINPFQVALICYALAFILYLLIQRSPQTFLLHLAALSVAAGIIFHVGGIAARMMILQRPPVATLYESLLFVGLVCIIAGIAIEAKRKDGLTGLISTISTLLVLAVSLYFGAQSGDSLSMLIAVLNTNFWLATHVLIVTAGYGLCLLAAMTAHAWLMATKDRTGLFTLMHRLALAGLLFTGVGTILGGIWADQSWGRFWGWDPKENGALLIVLWIVWLLHGRMAGQIKTVPYAVGIGFLNIVVALAWFGVNLLSVGLHSYGFISGIAAGLVTFCAAESLLLAYLWHRKMCHA